MIFSLLEDKKRRNKPLQVNHNGENKDRFTAAMEERNQDFILNGQPDAVRHVCKKCLREFETKAGIISALI